MKGMRIFGGETSQSLWSLQHCEGCIHGLVNRLAEHTKWGEEPPPIHHHCLVLHPLYLLHKNRRLLEPHSDETIIFTVFWFCSSFQNLLASKTWEIIVLKMMLLWILHLSCMLASNGGALFQRMLWALRDTGSYDYRILPQSPNQPFITSH